MDVAVREVVGRVGALCLPPASVMDGDLGGVREAGYHCEAAGLVMDLVSFRCLGRARDCSASGRDSQQIGSQNA